MPVLQADDIHKHYREAGEAVRVLKGISLALEPGEIVAMEGPSGSGKTTFLSILGCLLTPTSGRLDRGARWSTPAARHRLWRFRRDSIGFMSSSSSTCSPRLTAAENVEYALNVKGHRGQAGAGRGGAAGSARSGLADRVGFRPRDLSGGQKQRVAVARALAGGRRSSWPTSRRATSTTRRASRSSTCSATWPSPAEGRAVLIVTHDPKVRRIADRVVKSSTVHDGRRSAEGGLDESMSPSMWAWRVIVPGLGLAAWLVVLLGRSFPTAAPATTAGEARRIKRPQAIATRPDRAPAWSPTAGSRPGRGRRSPWATEPAALAVRRPAREKAQGQARGICWSSSAPDESASRRWPRPRPSSSRGRGRAPRFRKREYQRRAKSPTSESRGVPNRASTPAAATSKIASARKQGEPRPPSIAAGCPWPATRVVSPIDGVVLATASVQVRRDRRRRRIGW